MAQTVEDRLRIIAAINARLLPALMSSNEGNGHLLKGYLMQKYGMVADTAGNIEFTEAQLWDAMNALADRLEWTVLPAKLKRNRARDAGVFEQSGRLTSAEIEQKRKDAIEAAEAAELKEFNAKCEKEIAWMKAHVPPVLHGGSNGKINHFATQARALDFANIKAFENGVYSPRLTVLAMREALSNMDSNKRTGDGTYQPGRRVPPIG